MKGHTHYYKYPEQSLSQFMEMSVSTNIPLFSPTGHNSL